jgi:hypothetical protein
LLSAVLLVGCGSGSKSTGSEGGACYGNQTCNSGLECLSSLCVRPNGADGGPAGAAGSAGIGGSAGAAGSAGTAGIVGSGGADAGQAVSSYSVHFGPVSVAAGSEDTQCIVVRLGNPSAVHVGQIHNLASGTATLVQAILYKVTDTTEQTTPFECTPFVGMVTQSGMTPLIASQKADDLLTMPQGVAMSLDANQMVRLEVHFMNGAAGAASLSLTSTLTTVPDTQFQNEASFLFIGDPDISIPPNGSFTLGPVFFPLPTALAAVKFFAATGEQHHFGTGLTVSTVTAATDSGAAFYSSQSWNDPPTTTLVPPAQIAAGGGFKFQCSWQNSSATTVKYGVAAGDEACFFAAYYYPSQGPLLCVHTDQVSGGLDVCCPGNSLCGSIQLD